MTFSLPSTCGARVSRCASIAFNARNRYGGDGATYVGVEETQDELEVRLLA